MNDAFFRALERSPKTIKKLNKLVEVVNKLNSWVKKNLPNTDVEIVTLEDSFDERNERYDIEIRYYNGSTLIQQKLLFLNGEILDGNEFHKRFEEFYGREAI